MSKITMLTSDRLISKDFYPYVLKDNSPKWFREMSREDSYDGARTYKACPALIESFKRIIVIPAWSDFQITIEDDIWRVLSAMPTDNPKTGLLNDEPVTGHKDWQHVGYREDKHILKFMSPWQMEIEGPSMVWFTHPHFHDERRFEAVTGITDMSIQSSTHINTYWPKSRSTYKVKAGQPLTYIVPLMEDFDFNIEVIDRNELLSRSKHIEYSLTKSEEYWKKKASNE